MRKFFGLFMLMASIIAIAAPAAAQDGGDNQPPKLFDAQSCSPTHTGGCLWDLGTNEGQVSLAFGVDLSWDTELRAQQNRCELVVLPEDSWFEDFRVVDGRVEVYSITDPDYWGWVQSLVSLRVAEQAGHYDCPDGYDHVLIWDPDEKSFVSLVETDWWPGDPDRQVKNERMTTGKGGEMAFEAGTPVIAWSIKLEDGTEYNQCYLEEPKLAGKITDGVAWPNTDEVAAATPCK